MGDWSDTTNMSHIRGALRVVVEGRFAAGKELSHEEFELLAVQLFEDQMTGKPDAAKILNPFFDREDIKARLKQPPPPDRFAAVRVKLAFPQSLRLWLDNIRWYNEWAWPTEETKFLRIKYGEDGYDEAQFDCSTVYYRDVLKLTV